MRRLRVWFLVAAILMVAVVTGFYFYARWQIHERITKPLAKIGLNIQQSAESFTISRSDGGRTLFTIKAGKVIQLKLSGHATLEDVRIIVYGKDSSRYDQITGKRFEYDKDSGDITAQGDVDIDLQGNAAGTLAPDQAFPSELKNPIHLKTSGLVFNQKSGDGYTKERIEFQVPQASGSAVGARYDSKTRALTLASQVELQNHGSSGPRDRAANLHASAAVITADPRRIALESATVTTSSQTMSARHADILLRPDNSVDRIDGSGGVKSVASGSKGGTLQAQEAHFFFRSGVGRNGILQAADFRGQVQAKAEGNQPAEGSAEHLHVQFAIQQRGHNTGVGAESARAEGNVHLVQLPSGASGQRTEVSAPAMDLHFQNGHLLRQAETDGAGQITIIEAPAGSRGPAGG